MELYADRLTRDASFEMAIDCLNNAAIRSSVSCCMILSTETRDVTLRDSGPFQISQA
jgi:hypothetical protein